MNDQKQKRPALAESGISKSIHLDPVNNPYLNMMRNNRECTFLCCEFLQIFGELLVKCCLDNPQVFKGNELKALYNIQSEYRRHV